VTPPPSREDDTAPGAASAKRALVVDGRAGVRALVTEVLQREGFDVVAAGAPPAGLRLDRLRLLIVTENDAAAQLVRELRGCSPQLAVVYVTDAGQESPPEDNRVRLLTPFTIPELKSAASRAFQAALTRLG
jgi:hypothetical protein